MADRTNTDIPAIKKGHEFGNGFPFYRASGINTVPELVDQFQFFRFLAVTEVAGKAYTAEPFGEHMHEEGVQELGSAHMHGLGFSIIRVIFVVERHTGIIYGINPAVADGAAEYVACRISDSVAGPVKCFLDMRDPVFMVKIQKISAADDPETAKLKDALDKYSGSTELTNDMVKAFIDQVLMFEPGKIEIRSNFSEKLMKMLLEE